MICSCCKQAKQDLTPMKSKLLSFVGIVICNKCKAKNHEPRQIVMLAAHADGIKQVASHIKERRYCGNPILASELTD